MAPLCSVSQCETLADMGRLFEFVDDGDGQVVDRNVARLVAVHQHLVATQTEASSALAGGENGCRRDEGPGEGLFLAMNTSAVSQQVRQLERDNGVTLLHRSTRKLSLTAAGEQFYEGCAAMVAAARRAQQQLAHSRDAPTGELRISAPVGFARHIAPALGEVLAAHPGLTMTLLVDDARIDLIEARIDLAVRGSRRMVHPRALKICIRCNGLSLRGRVMGFSFNSPARIMSCAGFASRRGLRATTSCHCSTCAWRA